MQQLRIMINSYIPLAANCTQESFFIQKARRNCAAATPSNKISSLQPVAPQFSPQNLCRPTQKLRRFTQNLCS